MKNYQDLDKQIAGLRKDYAFGALEEGACADDPYVQFVKWFEAALKTKVNAINAVTLSTCGKNRKPSARILLIKGFDPEGFIFFTGYESRKAREIQENPRGEILFFWPEMERQVRIFGKISKISAARSDAYFRIRPRAAQIGAWASRQSDPIKDRRTLEEKLQKIEKEFSGKVIPRPGSWGGYSLHPESYEFWQGRMNRVNDRILYTQSAKRWKRIRLQP